jgi:ribosome-associated protein
MKEMLLRMDDVKFKAVRSRGPGGERTDRRSTKVQMWVKIDDLPLSEQDKKTIRRKLAHHINQKDELWVQEEEERSQKMNRDKAISRLNIMIEEALLKPPKRIPTTPPRQAEEARLRAKKIKSQKKKSRKPPKINL